MRKRGRKRSSHRLLILILAMGLGAIGTTYGMWSKQLNVRTRVTTAVFHMVFPETGDYPVTLIDGDGMEVYVLDAAVNIAEDGKQAELLFHGGIPSELWRQGYRLKLEYPLEMSEDGNYGAVKEVEEDGESDSLGLTESEEQITLLAGEGAILMDGVFYEGGDYLEEYQIPLECHVGREVFQDEDGTSGAIYLWLTEESVSRMEGLPLELEVEEGELEELLQIPENWQEIQVENFDSQIITSGSGIVVSYRCEVPLYLDQAGAGQENGGAGMLLEPDKAAGRDRVPAESFRMTGERKGG